MIVNTNDNNEKNTINNEFCEFNFGKILKRIRTQKGITQKNLADGLCVTQQTIAKWESGIAIPQLDRLKEIALLLDIAIEELFFDNEDKYCYKIPIDNKDNQKEKASYVSLNEYEYNLFIAIKRISPEYKIDDFFNTIIKKDTNSRFFNNC